MFGKNIKSKLEDLLEEKIQVFFQNKAKESKSIYNKEFEMLYVNHVLIRFYKDLSFSQNTELDNNFFNANGLFEKSEQKFRINSGKLLSKNSRSSLENFGEKLMIENIGSMMKDLTTYLLKVSSKARNYHNFNCKQIL